MIGIVASFLFLGLLTACALYITSELSDAFSRIFQLPLRGPKSTGRDKADEPDPRLTISHPFVGYVLNPRGPDAASNPPNKHGFPGPRQLVQLRSDDAVVIGITGGSVARDFAINGRKQFVESLQQYPAFSSKTIDFNVLAIGGFRQPQQLMALTFALAAGATFDILINIDGFNEVALYPAENRYFGSSPLYPRNWATRLELPKDQLTRLVRGGTYFEMEIARLDAHIKRKHVIVDALSLYILNLYRSRLMKLNAFNKSETLRSLAITNDLELLGPPFEMQSDASMYEELASIWYRNSVLLHRLSTCNDIKYFHFLQPNQYVMHSKPLSQVETATAFDEFHPYRKGVLQGYDHLRSKASFFANEGLRYEDLTMIFSNEPRTVYRDTCCHFNELGQQMMSDRIARTIGEATS